MYLLDTTQLYVLMKQPLAKRWLSPGTNEYFNSGKGVEIKQTNQTTN